MTHATADPPPEHGLRKAYDRLRELAGMERETEMEPIRFVTEMPAPPGGSGSLR